MKVIEALKKAEVGGWQQNNTERYTFLLDIDFWKSLGESLGWTGEKIHLCTGCGVALRGNEVKIAEKAGYTHARNGQGLKGCGSDIYEYDGQWLVEMHKLIDHLAEGKTIAQFFKHLI